MNSVIDTYPLTAKVWVYMADRDLTGDESAQLQQNAQRFVTDWAAHGKDLSAHAEVRYNRFLILMVDEEKNMASGCSIDASVHFVQEAGKSLNVDFFNRMLMAFRDESNHIQTVRLPDIGDMVTNGKIQASTTIFNNLVNTRHGLDTEWEVALSQSPYARWL